MDGIDLRTDGIAVRDRFLTRREIRALADSARKRRERGESTGSLECPSVEGGRIGIRPQGPGAVSGGRLDTFSRLFRW